jgi:hypothetical protein
VNNDAHYGILIYDNERFSETIMARPRLNILNAYWKIPPHELKRLFENFWIYQGKYRTDKTRKIVRHIIEQTSENFGLGGIIERRYSLVGSRMIMLAIRGNKKGYLTQITWKRLN